MDQYDAESSTLDPSKSKDTQSDVKSLVPLAQGLAKEYQAVNQSLESHKASSDEVAKEAPSLEADDPQLADLADKLIGLNLEKKTFDVQMVEAMNKATSLSSTIFSDWQSIDTTNRAISYFWRYYQ